MLFLVTVATGSVLIVLNAPVVVIAAGTLLAGSVALFGTGALKVVDLKPSRLLSRGKKEPASVKPAKVKKEKPEGKVSSPSIIQKLAATEIDTSRLRGMLGTFLASIRDAITHFHASDDEKRNSIKKIDALLDQAVDGVVPDQPLSPTPPKAAGGAADPFASLAELDDDSLSEFDIDGEGAETKKAFMPEEISLLSEEDANAVSEILKAHQSAIDDLDLSADLAFSGDDGFSPAMGDAAATLPPLSVETPDVPVGDGALEGLEEMPDVGELSTELSALDDLDLDEIEIYDEADDGDEAALPDSHPEAGVSGQSMEESKESDDEDFDMVSFAAGGGVDDDLIAELKSEAKKKTFVEDTSLLRELKGSKYDAHELAQELEDILSRMGSK
jgi:hypothetical protein